MLTDEEIMAIRNRAKLNDSRQIDPMSFAREVERAVLAKAGEKQVIAYYDSYMPNNIRWISGGFICTVKQGDPIYAHPLPAQEIPEGWQLVPIEPTKEMCDAYCEHSIAPIGNLSRYGYKAMLSASPKP